MIRPLRLLWVNHFAVSPADGGGTRHFDLARELTRRGWQVTIAASDFHLHSRTYTRRRAATAREPIVERIDDVEFLWLWAAPYARNDWHRAHNWLSFARSLRRYSPNGSRPDIVIGSSPHLFAAHAAARLAKRLDVPFVLEIRDLWPESLVAAGGRRGPAYHGLDALARRLYARAERIVVLARGVREYLAQRGIARERLVYVPNGADPSPEVDGPRPRDGRPFTLIYAGAHGPANGLDTVLEAAALLRDARVRFRLVGDGPAKASLRDHARRLALESVQFDDPVAKREVPELLASADAGLMVLRDAPLFSYGVSPNKLFDYMAAGLPVVCNVPGEVADMLREARAGAQAANASPRALADAILQLARQSTEERVAMGNAGRAWLAREHGRAVLADRLDGMLRPLVAR